MDSTPSSSKATLWTSYVISALAALLFLFSAAMKLVKPPGLAEGFTHLNLSLDLARGLGALELTCVVLYMIPRTAVLGAVLLTGYLGGAIITHLRVGDPYIVQFILGVAVWAALWLREPRLHALLPFRR